MLSAEQQRNTVALCCDLLRIPSASGQEASVVSLLRQYMYNYGFDDVIIDRYGSIIGCVHGARPGPKLLFDGHLDTVPVPDPGIWTQNPYGGVITGGRIYGRGATDMKGSVAAMTCAAASFLCETEHDFAGSLYVAASVQEERFQGIVAREISAIVNPDIVVIGAASELNVKVGQRGRAEILLETYGTPAHSSHPEQGVNAVLSMLKFISEVEKIPTPMHPQLGLGVSVLTDIISTPHPGASVVPSRCRAGYDRRLLPGETHESVLAPYKEALDRLSALEKNFRASADFVKNTDTCYTGSIITGERFCPGWLFSEKEDFVQISLSGLRAAGLSPAISHYSTCTNGSHYAGERGIRTIGFGPSREDIAHTIDEYVEETQLLAAAAGYEGLAAALLTE